MTGPSSESASDALAIPRGPADVTPEWLTAVLRTDVRAVQVTPIGTGQTGATYRLAVEYGLPSTDLPTTFAIKLSSQDDAVRERVALGYRSEHAFYTEVADEVRVPLPRHYHCEISTDGGDFVLLLADLAPAVQGDQIRGCTPAEADLGVRALAGLHGPTWCDPRWTDFPGVVMSVASEDAIKGLGDIAVLATTMTLERLGARMTAQDRETAAEAMSLATRWLMADRDRFALLHGDYRLDNLLFDPDRTRVTVVDWQTLGVGLPARDLAYFTGHQPASRRAGLGRRGPRHGLPRRVVGLRRHRLRPRDVLARLPGGHASGATDHDAGMRVLHLDRAR